MSHIICDIFDHYVMKLLSIVLSRARQRAGRLSPEIFDPGFFRTVEKFDFEPITRPGFEIQP